MEEGTVARWCLEVGATVHRGDVIAEIDTDKATMDYEAEAGGTLLAILVREGRSVPVGTPIALLGEPGERPSEPHVPRDVPASDVPPPSPARPTRAPSPPGSRANASPVARRLAEELGIDLASLQGSGPNGQITKEDVQAAAGSRSGTSPPSSARGEVRLEPLTQMQRVIARRLVEGSTAPTFAVEAEIDMTAVVTFRAEHAANERPLPSLNDFVVKTAALALVDSPRLNGAFTESGFELHSRVNIGIAVALEDGLVVPTIFDADTRSLLEIGADSRRLAVSARQGTIALSDLDGGTFTVTNLGMFGASRFLPIINPPQAGILAVAAIAKRPRFDEEGNLVARHVMSATLVCDHRIVYGADAARFLGRVSELLRHPDELVEG
jgi:pyruvate dehydrogenase E2 component (dihydrolipoamide acetyltransferase)